LGEFTSSVDFDPGPGSSIISALGNNDVFISKFDLQGNFQWSRGFGGIWNESGYSIDVSEHGILATGSYDGTVDFDPGAGVTSLSTNGGIDVFVSKFSTSGQFVWARSFGGGSADVGYGVKAAPNGKVLVVGQFYGTVDFDPGHNLLNLVATGASDGYVLALSSLGAFEWAKKVGGTSYDVIKSVEINADSSFYVLGSFQGTADLNPSNDQILSRTASGGQDIFVSKFDSTGALLWARAFGGFGSDFPEAVVANAAGEVFIVGEFSGVLSLSPSVTPLSVTSAGSDDGFVTRMDAEGNFKWLKRFGGSFSDGARDVALRANGDVLVGGYFFGVSEFASEFGGHVLESKGYSDGFLLWFDSYGNFEFGTHPSFGSLSGGQEISIRGSQFDQTTSFRIGGQNCSNVNVISTSLATCLVPAAMTEGWADLVAFKSGIQGQVNGKYQYVVPPSASSVSPSSGSTAGGETLRISGTRFSANTSVSIGGRACTQISLISSTQIECISPEGTRGVATLAVSNFGISSVDLVSFNYLVFPPQVGLIIASPGDRSIRLSWDEMQYPGSPILDFVIRMSANGGNWMTIEDGVTPSTSVLVTGLSNGTSYIFQVAAVNSDGQSLFSLPTEPITPGRGPTAPSISSITSSNASINLTLASPSPSEPMISDYIVQYSADGSSWVTYNDGISDTRTFVISGLLNGTAYLLRVAAVNMYGTGDFAVSSSTVTPAGIPSAPEWISVNAKDGEAVVRWGASQSNGAPVTSYRVVGSPNGSCITTTTSCSLTGLTNGVTYTFAVTPTNEIGNGFTAISSARPLALPPVSTLQSLPMNLVISVTRVDSGGSLYISHSGFLPYEWVAIVVQSSPQMLGTVQANAQGSLSTSVQIPGSLTGGTHTVSIVGSINGFGARSKIEISGTTSSIGLSSLSPSRILNTRLTGAIGARDGSAGPLVLNVFGKGGVPASGVSAVVLNVTAVEPEVGGEGGFLTVYPCASGRPDASNLNFVSGQIVPNLVIAPVDVNGNICFYSYGKTHLLADVSGYFP
jgi:hypothetical protein